MLVASAEIMWVKSVDLSGNAIKKLYRCQTVTSSVMRARFQPQMLAFIL